MTRVFCGGSGCGHRQYDHLGRGVCDQEDVSIMVDIDTKGKYIYFECDTWIEKDEVEVGL